MHHSISQMKHQLDATLFRFCFCRVALHVSGVKRPSSGVFKTSIRFKYSWWWALAPETCRVTLQEIKPAQCCIKLVFIWLDLSNLFYFGMTLCMYLSLHCDFCSLFQQHTNKCTYIVFNNLKCTLKHLKVPTCFDHMVILREHTLFLANVTVNCNFSKEQSILPEDDRMIETC